MTYHPSTGNAYSIRPSSPFKMSATGSGKRTSSHLMNDLYQIIIIITILFH